MFVLVGFFAPLKWILSSLKCREVGNWTSDFSSVDQIMHRPSKSGKELKLSNGIYLK